MINITITMQFILSLNKMPLSKGASQFKALRSGYSVSHVKYHFGNDSTKI
jgi:hypothetical protein